MGSMPQWAKLSMLRVVLPAAWRSHRGWVSLADGSNSGTKLGDGGTLSSAICSNTRKVSGGF